MEGPDGGASTPEVFATSGEGADMKPIKLFGHPLHPPLTHFPMGLLCTVPLWDAVALWRGDPVWWTVGFWTLALGLVAALPTALTGLLDYAALPVESPAGRTARLHLFTAATAIALSAGSFLVRVRTDGPEPAAAKWAVGLSVAGALGLGLAGWWGAELTFGHGVGVARDRLESSGEDADGAPDRGEGRGGREGR